MLEILFPLAGTKADDVATDHALRVARLLDAKVHLVRVLESRRSDDRPTDPVDWQIKKGEAENLLSRVAEQLTRAGVESEQVLLRATPPSTWSTTPSSRARIWCCSRAGGGTGPWASRAASCCGAPPSPLCSPDRSRSRTSPRRPLTAGSWWRGMDRRGRSASCPGCRCCAPPTKGRGCRSFWRTWWWSPSCPG